MVKSNPDPAREPGKQSIEQLQERYQTLNTEKIRAETELKNATERLDELKNEAREKFGTDDVTELQQQLATMRAENEQKRAKYQTDLDQIESDLATVDREFTAQENAQGKGPEPA
jgi:chromosome segregation ATPase